MSEGRLKLKERVSLLEKALAESLAARAAPAPTADPPAAPEAAAVAAPPLAVVAPATRTIVRGRIRGITHLAVELIVPCAIPQVSTGVVGDAAEYKDGVWYYPSWMPFSTVHLDDQNALVEGTVVRLRVSTKFLEGKIDHGDAGANGTNLSFFEIFPYLREEV